MRITSLTLALLGMTMTVAAQGSSHFQLKSPAFSEGETIPKRFTADGDGISPPLRWSGLPNGTSELALIVDDPDAPSGTYTHWVLYGISPKTREIIEGKAPSEALQGKSS